MNISQSISSDRCRGGFMRAGAAHPGILPPGQTTLITGAGPGRGLQSWLIFPPGNARPSERTAGPFARKA